MWIRFCDGDVVPRGLGGSHMDGMWKFIIYVTLYGWSTSNEHKFQFGTHISCRM